MEKEVSTRQGRGGGGGGREERKEQKSGYVIGMKLCEVEL